MDIHSGIIKKYDPIRRFGFIVSMTGTTFFFFLDKKDQVKKLNPGEPNSKLHKYNNGDEVEFYIRKSIKHEPDFEAFDLKFIKNVNYEIIVNEFIQNRILFGILKKYGEKFYVLHKPTNHLLPLKISEWENCNIYESLLNSIVEFELPQIVKINKLSASLKKKFFLEQYHKIIKIFENKELTEAKITGKNYMGYFASILNGQVQARINLNKQLSIEEANEKFFIYEKGDLVWTRIKYNPTSKVVSLEFAP